MSESASLHQASSKPNATKQGNISLDNRRILIVDDTHSIHQDFEKILLVENSSSLEDMEAMLFGQGLSQTNSNAIDFELDSAFQGHEALEKVKQAVNQNRPYALAFVDVRMPPGWDGIQTIEYLWQVDPNLQIVICTAYSDYSWQETFDRLGNNDNLLILKKPFENIEVLQMANALVYKWNSTAQAKIKLADMEHRVVSRTEKIAEQNRQLENKIEELNRTRAQLIQSEKLASIGQLAAGIAHEINNPLGFIHSNLDVLSGYIDNINAILKANQTLAQQLASSEKLALSGQGKAIEQKLSHLTKLNEELDIDYIQSDMPELISEALNGTARVKEIVADLKDYSHMRQQAMEFEDINQLIEQAIKISANETKYRVDIIKNLNPLPKVECWRGKITQVILNLLLNANQALSTGEQEGKIEINTHAQTKEETQAEQDKIIISIKDNGAGISEENLPKIFDPFFTTKEIGAGTGLGLHICHSIITSHGGTINATSTPNQGTTFEISLPVENKQMRQYKG